MITAGIGRYGPFVKMGSTYANIPEDESVLEIGLNRAVALINEKQKKVKDKAAPGTELGATPSGRKTNYPERRSLRALCQAWSHQCNHP